MPGKGEGGAPGRHQVQRQEAERAEEGQAEAAGGRVCRAQAQGEGLAAHAQAQGGERKELREAAQ